MPSVNVYLNFNGNCEEAFLFYKKAFSVPEFQVFSRFSDMPPHEGAPSLPEDMKNQIMHVSLRISEETVIMGSDTGGDWAPLFKQGNNFSICIFADSTENADQFFAALSEGGIVKMPMMNMFWGEYYGMLEDKFGINWMVSYRTAPKH